MADAGGLHLAPVERPAAFHRELLREIKAGQAPGITVWSLQHRLGRAVEVLAVGQDVASPEVNRERRSQILFERGLITNLRRQSTEPISKLPIRARKQVAAGIPGDD